MTKLHIVFLGAICLLAAGCVTTTAEMLARPGSDFGQKNGPDYGLIRYQVSSNTEDMQARQRDADMQMSNACQGHYRVLSQSSRGSLTSSPGGGRRGLASNVQTQDYVYVKFVCTK